MNKNKCADQSGCIYSKSMNQPHPRLCIKCGHPEESAIDHARIELMRMKEFDIRDIVQLLSVIHHRNEIIKARSSSMTCDWETWEGMISQINKDIKKILQLT